MSAQPFTVRSIVPSIPKENTAKFVQQQLPDISTFSNLKQEIFSGGLNPTVGTTRSVTLRKKTHISFFHWSIKGKPDAACEVQLYAVINGQTKQIIRHGMPLFAWHNSQAVTDEEYQDRAYNWIPPIIFTPVTPADTLNVKVDGGADGNFCLVYYEEPV